LFQYAVIFSTILIIHRHQLLYMSGRLPKVVKTDKVLDTRTNRDMRNFITNLKTIIFNGNLLFIFVKFLCVALSYI